MADVGIGLSEAIGVGATVLGGGWALIKAIVSPHIKTVEEHSQKISALEKRRTVGPEDLEKTERTVIGAIDRVATQIGVRIDEVQRTANKAHERLDVAQQEELARLRAEHHSNG